MDEDRGGSRRVPIDESLYQELERAKNGTSTLARPAGGSSPGCIPIIVLGPDGPEVRCSSGCPWYKWLFGGGCQRVGSAEGGQYSEWCYCDWGILEPVIGRSAPAGVRAGAIGAALFGVVMLLRRPRR
jgi:hypothetical protein